MKIKATNIGMKDVRISFEAEGEAEMHQLDWLVGELIRSGADWSRWNDGEGCHGVTVIAKEKAPA